MHQAVKDSFRSVIDRIMFMQCMPQNAIEHDVLLNALFALNNQVQSGSIVLPEERADALRLLMVRAGVGKLVTIFGGSANLTPETVVKARDAALEYEPDERQLTRDDMERVACVACGAHIGCSCIVPNPGVLGIASVDGRYYHIWRRKLALMERTRIAEEHAGGLARVAAHDEVKTWQLSMGEVMAMPCSVCSAGSGVACESDNATVFVRTSGEHAWCHEERLTAATLARVESEQAQPGEDNLDQGDGPETDELAQRRRAAVARATENEPLFASASGGETIESAMAKGDARIAQLSQGWERSVAIHPDELEQINDERRDRSDLISVIVEAAKHHDALGSKYEARGNATGAAQLRAVGGLLWSINNERKFVGILPDVPTAEPVLDLATAGLRTRIEVVVERELRRYGGASEPEDFSSVSVLIAGAVADMLEGEPGRSSGEASSLSQPRIADEESAK